MQLAAYLSCLQILDSWILQSILDYRLLGKLVYKFDRQLNKNILCTLIWTNKNGINQVVQTYAVRSIHAVDKVPGCDAYSNKNKYREFSNSLGIIWRVRVHLINTHLVTIVNSAFASAKEK